MRGDLGSANPRNSRYCGFTSLRPSDLRNSELLVVEPESAQQPRVPLPVLGNFDPQIQEDSAAEERLDLLPCPRTNLLKPGSLGPDDDGLLAWPLHVQHRMDVDQVGAALAGRHLLDHDSDRVRQLVADSLQARLPDQLRHELF